MSDTNSQPHHSSATHNTVQHSTTLNRRYVRRPHSYTRTAQLQPAEASSTPVTAKKSTATPSDSDFVNRFLASVQTTPTPQAVATQTSIFTASTSAPVNAMQPANSFQTAVNNRITAQHYQSASAQASEDSAEDLAASEQISALESSLAAAAESAKSAEKSPDKAEQTSVKSLAAEAPASAKENQALTDAIHAIATKEDSTKDKKDKKSAKKSKNPKVKRSSSPKRFIIAFSAACACVAALGLFIHMNLPDVSFRVAAMQTGIEASYPTYIPRDYQLTSVYTEQEDKVTIEFTNDKDQKFSLSEEKSSWDSSALLNNFVKDKWGEEYTTIREQGITIYTAGSNAIWVNGGILYHISADAGTLTKKQLKNIAVSL